MSTEFPPLQSPDHKVFGQEYCSGYSDEFGHWNTGFYCPQGEPAVVPLRVLCCGTETYKYCCQLDAAVVGYPNSEPSKIDLETASAVLTPIIIHEPLLSGIICGLIISTILISLGVCYFYSCCIFYNKRNPATTITTTTFPPGLYQLHCNSSSSTSGSSICTSCTSASSSNNVYSALSNLSSTTTTTPLLDLQTVLLAYRDFLMCDSQHYQHVQRQRLLNFASLNSQQAENIRSILRAISIISSSRSSSNNSMNFHDYINRLHRIPTPTSSISSSVSNQYASILNSNLSLNNNNSNQSRDQQNNHNHISLQSQYSHLATTRQLPSSSYQNNCRAFVKSEVVPKNNNKLTNLNQVSHPNITVASDETSDVNSSLPTAPEETSKVVDKEPASSGEGH